MTKFRGLFYFGFSVFLLPVIIIVSVIALPLITYRPKKEQPKPKTVYDTVKVVNKIVVYDTIKVYREIKRIKVVSDTTN